MSSFVLMPRMGWIWCLLVLFWTTVHGGPCANKPYAPYSLYDKCVECIHHCDCPNLGDYCTKEGIFNRQERILISDLGVCLTTEHIIKGDVCIHPSLDGSPPVDEKFFCGVYDYASSKVILLGKFGFSYKMNWPLTTRTLGFCNRKRCEACVDTTTSLMNTADLQFYLDNWDKTLMCPGTQCANGTLTHKTPVRTMLETYVDIPIGLEVATLFVLIFISFIELFMCICRLLWIDATIYKNKIL